MLDAMPDVSLGDLTRRAIEDLFEGKNDREYARICLKEDMDELLEKWKAELGLISDLTITATEDGFRIVAVALKKYGPGSKSISPPLPAKNQESITPPRELDDEDFDDWVDQDD